MPRGDTLQVMKTYRRGTMSGQGLFNYLLVLARPSAHPSSRPCRRKSFHRSLADELAFELAHAAEDGEKEPPLRRGRVKPRLLQRLDVRPGLLHLLDQVEEILDRTAEPGELADDDGVPFPEHIHHPEEFRTILPGSGELLLENPVAPLFHESVYLPVQVLVERRAAGIS